MSNLSTDNPYPRWYTPSDIAKSDAVIRRFTDLAFDHRQACETCLRKQPCSTIRDMIDGVEAELRSISDPAFAAYTEAVERKYAPRDWRAP